MRDRGKIGDDLMWDWIELLSFDIGIGEAAKLKAEVASGALNPREVKLRLARELHEEGNIELTGQPKLHGVFFHPIYSVRDHVTIYVVREFRQPSPPVPNSEIAAHGFFALDALPAETTKGTRARIAEVVHGQALTEKW